MILTNIKEFYTKYIRKTLIGILTATIVLIVLLIVEHTLIHYDILTKIPESFNGWMACTGFLSGSGRLNK
mgnify:CR=1 FL=1